MLFNDRLANSLLINTNFSYLSFTTGEQELLMKILSYGLDLRMEPRLAFYLRGHVIDVMRASLWMKEDRGAQDFLNLASSMKLALEDWNKSLSLLKQLEDSFQSLDFEGLSIFKRPVSMPESEVVFFAPVPDPPSLRFFNAFGEGSISTFHFGNTQTLVGHQQPLPVSGLAPQGEVAAIVARDKNNGPFAVAGYCTVNNWLDLSQTGGLAIGKATGMGPWMVTTDEVESHKLGTGLSLDMQVRVNGQALLDGRFNKMSHGFGDMVQIASETSIQAGDVISSGTPLVPDRALDLTSGDSLDLEIQVLGLLNTPIH